uniref:SWIM-type domain-containing protein n=1 Tax=Peronospora matthiolae TaxID=2874970 RepID=A0AAV1T4L9_9STRA
MSGFVAPRKDERFLTLADAIAGVEHFAEQTQQRHVRVQQRPSSSDAVVPGVSSRHSWIASTGASASTGAPDASSVGSNTVILECENAPSCKWFVRLLFVKGEKKWKISSMNVDHHKTLCLERKQAVATKSGDGAGGFVAPVVPTQLLNNVQDHEGANGAAMLELAATATGAEEEAGVINASVYVGMVFGDWKVAIGAVRALAAQTARRTIAGMPASMLWRGKSVMARRVVCQNHRNSKCGWKVVLGESGDGSERYTVLSMSLLHSRECLETCNFNLRMKGMPAAIETSAKADNVADSLTPVPGGTPLSSSLLLDDTSRYQLTHEMRWSTGKEATKAISDFTLVVQRKRSMLCKRNNGGSNKKYVCSDEQCLWFVQLVKGWKSKNWKISAMNLKHSDNCTGAPKPTARQLAEMRFFRQAVITHSKSSGKLLTDNFLMHSESGIHIPRGMAYRAQRMVVATSTDDLTESYKYIPSLIESFVQKNPGSIANYEKDAQGHFIRAFFMPNASRTVSMHQQQIFGIHVLHYDTVSYQGCMALLVTRDGNLTYQVVAFALLPASDVDNMKWFLAMAKRGDVRFEGNPVFCSHSEHGLLRALAHDAHYAKIMFCVRSLLEEMARDKDIPVLGPLEEKVWELQQQDSEEAFLNVFRDLEALNAAAAAFLRSVHPKNWACYLNQTVRLYRWTSTGADEAIVGSDIRRSDEAPFDLMYTFLAFLMDGIFKKSQLASKLLANDGQSPLFLTPGADAIYRQGMQAAAGYTVRRCDEQVAFAWITGARPKITYRIDVALRTCTCGQMFQLGLPCCHLIAASMHLGNEAVILDSVDPVYKAATYAEVHRNLRIEIPVAGDLQKDPSLLPAISTRSAKSKKRSQSAVSTSGAASSSLVHSSTTVLSTVSSTIPVSCEDALSPPGKAPRLDLNTDVVNSLSEVV